MIDLNFGLVGGVECGVKSEVGLLVSERQEQDGAGERSQAGCVGRFSCASR